MLPLKQYSKDFKSIERREPISDYLATWVESQDNVRYVDRSEFRKMIADPNFAVDHILAAFEEESKLVKCAVSYGVGQNKHFNKCLWAPPVTHNGVLQYGYGFQVSDMSDKEGPDDIDDLVSYSVFLEGENLFVYDCESNSLIDSVRVGDLKLSHNAEELCKFYSVEFDPY